MNDSWNMAALKCWIVTDSRWKMNDPSSSSLSDQLESYQKRALRIIYGDQIKGMPYQNALFLANLESLKDRRIKLSQSFFKKILSTDSCLHTLLPLERNNEIFCKLRNPWCWCVEIRSQLRCRWRLIRTRLSSALNKRWSVIALYKSLLVVNFPTFPWELSVTFPSFWNTCSVKKCSATSW